jgi:hypothetical protein
LILDEYRLYRRVLARKPEGDMKRISIAMIAALALALVACSAEKAAEVVKTDEAVKPAAPAPAPAPEPARPADEAVKTAEPAPAAPAPAAVPAGERTAPEVVQLALEGAKKGAVTFPHKAHAGFPIMEGKCSKCHHTSDEKGTGAQKCTTPGCHDGKGKIAPKDAFHDLCRGCHTKALAAQPDNAKLKGLKSCKGCHAG